MLDHIILTVSDVERSLAFYEAALKPLNIKFFMPFKGEDGHPDLWGFGDGKRAIFWIKQGKPDPASIHWGFMAETNDGTAHHQGERSMARSRRQGLRSMARRSLANPLQHFVNGLGLAPTFHSLRRTSETNPFRRIKVRSSH